MKIVYLICAFGLLIGAEGYGFVFNQVTFRGDTDSLLHDVSIIRRPDDPPTGPFENRRTYEQYAAEHGMTVQAVYDKFMATGKIVCPGEFAAGNVTVDTKIVTTAAHVFYTGYSHSHQSCEKRPFDFTSCYFVTLLAPGRWSKRYHVKRVTVARGLASGTECMASRREEKDWAVVELDSGVDGVKPYSIKSHEQLAENTKISLVSATYHSFGNGIEENCDIFNVGNNIPDDDYSKFRVFKTDCTSEHGASGSALFYEQDGELYLKGLLSESGKSS